MIKQLSSLPEPLPSYNLLTSSKSLEIAVRAMTKAAATMAALFFTLGTLGADKTPTPAPSPLAGMAFKNLQVLPKDIKPEDLVVVMHKISTGLGVDCDYCHSPPKAGKPLPPGADDL